MSNDTIQWIVIAALAIPTLLAFGAMFVLRRASKVDEYLEPFGAVAECEVADAAADGEK